MEQNLLLQKSLQSLNSRSFNKLDLRFDLKLSSSLLSHKNNDELYFYLSKYRTLLDSSYHSISSYSKSRINIQNQIILDILIENKNNSNISNEDISNHQWLIFSCGPMGCGKTTIIKWIQDKCLFPIGNNIINIDIDDIRKRLPERKLIFTELELINFGIESQKESGLISELCVIAGTYIILKLNIFDINIIQ